MHDDTEQGQQQSHSMFRRMCDLSSGWSFVPVAIWSASGFWLISDDVLGFRAPWETDEARLLHPNMGLLLTWIESVVWFLPLSVWLSWTKKDGFWWRLSTAVILVGPLLGGALGAIACIVGRLLTWGLVGWWW